MLSIDPDNDHFKTLCDLCRKGDVESVKNFMNECDAKLILHLQDEKPFRIALSLRNMKLVNFFLSLEGDLRINMYPEGEGSTPIFNHFWLFDDIEAMEFLCSLKDDRMIDIHYEDDHYIRYTLSLEVIKFLCSLENERYVDIHKNNEFLFRNLCGLNKIKAVKYLMSLEGDRKIDIHAKDDDCLRAACRNGSTKMVKFLLSLEGNDRINIHSRDDEAFIIAGVHMYTHVLEYFLSMDGDRWIDLRANDYRLFRLICESSCNKYGYFSCIKLLLSLKGERKIDRAIINTLNIKNKYRLKIIGLLLENIRETRNAFSKTYMVSKNTMRNKKTALKELKSIPTGEFYENFPGGSDYLNYLNRYVNS